MTEPRYRIAVAAILGVLAAVTLWNAASYPPGMGFDADPHYEYAYMLVHEGRIPGPEKRSEYYTPPLFYAVSGAATVVGEQLGLGEPRRLALLVNAAVSLATAVLVLALARLLWPGRPLLHVAALGFFALVPVLAKTTAMFHPEPLSMFLSTLALLLAARMLVRRRYTLAAGAALGLALGAAQLVRAFSLWTFAAVLLALGVAALADRAARRQVLAAAGIAVAVTALVAGPWYLRQALHYTNPVFDRPTVAEPLWQRRPASFYVDFGLPELFSRPYRPSFVNRALPETYADLWGDWYGNFRWNSAKEEPSGGVRAQLALQHAVGLLPTLLAVAGWLALLVVSVRARSAPRLLVAALPAIAILGYLYFTVSYPTPDGDVLKATYMLTTAPAWALAFGFAVDRLAIAGRARRALPAALVLSALVNLPFLLYAGT